MRFYHVLIDLKPYDPYDGHRFYTDFESFSE